MLLEIACFNLESCLIAQEEGADRIELCENYKEGGVTPSEQVITEVRSKLKIPVHVIIRPRGGNFLYSLPEIETMKNSILFCKEQGIHGVVFGILNEDKTVNVAICEELVKLAKPMSVTFHRAVDECDDLRIEIEKLITLGVNRVLTSGGMPNAERGMDVIKNLQGHFQNKIIIMPGGGIRSAIISEIAKVTGAKEFHSSALLNNSFVADKNEIRLMKRILSPTIKTGTKN
jgi:copper homeostasis protein